MFAFIINKTSGNGKGHRVWKRVEKILEQEDLPFVARFTEGPQHAQEIVKDLSRKNLKTIIVVGGDGTIHEVANELAYKNISLGIIPAGSGNDFARCIGVPMNPLKALERIIANEKKQVDLLHLGHQYCLTVTGIGLDGQIAKNVNDGAYKKFFNQLRLGGLSYVVSLLETLRDYKPTNVQITIDGVDMTFSNVWLVAVANAPNYGGGITICPDASYNDGFLNLCIVHGIKKWELLRLFPKAYRGKHTTEKNVTFLQGKEVQVSSGNSIMVHSDGEQMTVSPIHIRIKKDALQVV
ncbi:diacylglycerol/lipid kinase family protein [Alteribacillus bidgolensis]|uniref:Lipid kinase, YegS/Rv2252/BmrU family n=1 Tax=Alteribacillus bidgolensis TaxID=930129 RepID=A0A1G8CV35_9BACI|nr:diacylglycerol kinase family protein [Alteribacillus bidgolensis]SDH48800.1 lipid kinase, YegS/Rv2252/BmrU family [Alteribacillus bidgolensis]